MTLSSVFSYRIPDPNHPHGNTFWGYPSSSVNWCEADYTFTRYIAEFFNTLSSLFMVLFGLLGNYSLRFLHLNPLNEPTSSYIRDPLIEDPYVTGINRLGWTWAALQLVGWGSVAFHATLQWWAQAFDEVPMVWTAILHLTTLLCARYDPLPISPASTRDLRKKAPGIISFLLPSSPRSPISMVAAIHAITCTALLTLFRGPTQFLIFHLLFGSVELAGFYYTYQILKDVESTPLPTLLQQTFASFSPLSIGLNHIKKLERAHRSPPVAGRVEIEYKPILAQHRADIRKLHNRGVWIYGIAVGIWSFELNFCHYVSKLPLPYYSFAQGAWEIIEWNPQLHGWWHFLVSVGFYHLHVLASYDRLVAGYREAWWAAEEGQKEVVGLYENEEGGQGSLKRQVAGKKDVPVIEWRWDIWPVVRISRGVRKRI